MTVAFKKDGSPRIAIDYRRVNKLVIHEYFCVIFDTLNFADLYRNIYTTIYG